MKDIAGNSLAVGDEVAICVPGYSCLQVRTIKRLTPKGVSVLRSGATSATLNRGSGQVCLVRRADEVVPCSR